MVFVELAGVEPASGQAIGKLSTCLVFINCRHNSCQTQATIARSPGRCQTK